MKKLVIIFVMLILAGCSNEVGINNNVSSVEEISTKETVIQNLIETQSDENNVMLISGRLWSSIRPSVTRVVWLNGACYAKNFFTYWTLIGNCSSFSGSS